MEAAGGYGKSVLAAEIVDAWGALPIWVMLEAGGVPARLFVARLRAAVADAGLSDAAGAIAAVGDDPAGAVDALLSGLAGESGAIVIDDAHNAERDAAALIERIARQLGPSTRLLVLARVLPGGLPALRRGGAVRLTAADLALRAPETLELCRTGFGLSPSAEEVTALDGATGGWTAAAVLAASRSRGSEQPLGAVARVGAGRTDLMASILEEALLAADRDRAVFARIAGPPLLDRELLAEITGERALLERALAWGLPMTPVQDGWWELPDPVREHLSALAAADPAVLRIAATHYQRRGELGRALQMLLASGQAAAAAELLDGADPWVIDRVDPLELLSAIDRIPPATLGRFPRAVLGVARCCAAAWLFEHSGPLLARLDASVDRRAQPELRRALDAELLTDLLNRDEPGRVEAPARRLLETAVGPGEQLTRARALTIIGLRTVLNRLRDVTPDTVAREGEHLCLGPDVRLDVAHFHAEARQALALGTGVEAGAAAIARSAIARYRGPLLPNDPYEEWAQEPRESARRTVLELLDLCAEIAVRRGDLDEARRIVERTIEIAPYDDHRYLRVASILHWQGRKGAALSVLSRARSALAQLGIDLPAPLVELERTVVAGDARQVAPETAMF
jgi:ATP/maltotriose-dependent transcriptional regulator MalT